MESGILMIVIVVIGVFYPVYTAWISLVAAPVYLKIGFLFAMAGALLVMRILRKEKQIKWIVLIGILGAYAWSLYSWYDEECHYQYARSVHGDSGNALMLFVGTFTCLIPLFLLDAELTWWMESRKKKKEESPESEKETEKKENRLAAGMKTGLESIARLSVRCLSVRWAVDFSWFCYIRISAGKKDVTIWPLMAYTVNSTGQRR